MKFDVAAYVHFNYVFVTIEWQDDAYAEIMIDVTILSQQSSYIALY